MSEDELDALYERRMHLKQRMDLAHKLDAFRTTIASDELVHNPSRWVQHSRKEAPPSRHGPQIDVPRTPSTPTPWETDAHAGPAATTELLSAANKAGRCWVSRTDKCCVIPHSHVAPVAARAQQ